jgi:hypothetical protein
MSMTFSERYGLSTRNATVAVPAVRPGAQEYQFPVRAGKSVGLT